MALTDVQRSTNYVLCVVLFATSLFFAGMGAKLPSQRLGRGAPLGMVVFLGTVAWIATSPVSFSV